MIEPEIGKKLAQPLIELILRLLLFKYNLIFFIVNELLVFELNHQNCTIISCNHHYLGSVSTREHQRSGMVMSIAYPN